MPMPRSPRPLPAEPRISSGALGLQAKALAVADSTLHLHSLPTSRRRHQASRVRTLWRKGGAALEEAGDSSAVLRATGWAVFDGWRNSCAASSAGDVAEEMYNSSSVPPAQTPGAHRGRANALLKCRCPPP